MKLLHDLLPESTVFAPECLSKCLEVLSVMSFQLANKLHEIDSKDEETMVEEIFAK